MSFFAKFDFLSWAPPIINLIISVIILKFVLQLVLKKNELDKENAWIRQSFFGFLVIVCIVGVIVSFPISTETRGQIFNLLGIAFTAVIALSSTSFVGNLMSALMLKVIGGIRPGDFLKVGEHFGRVSEQGLLHTEIQTEERTLTTLSNLYVITNPHTVVRSTGTIVSAEVSLGYDVSRHKIKEYLLEAAKRAGLKDAYVQVLNLGDFSVNYRIAGFLDKIKFLISVRSDLRAHVLDVLHENKVEIVSPNFMNQRVLDLKKEFIPSFVRPTVQEDTSAKPENLIFDKAEEAESKESIKELKTKVETQIKELETELKNEEITEEDKTKIETRVENLKKREKRLLEMLQKLEG